jgi:hypothetical protein
MPHDVRLETPNEGCLRAFSIDEVPRPSCIVDDSRDLAAMADDALILEQTSNVALAEARDPVEIETMEGRAEVLALGKNRAPAQSRLKTLQTQFLEQAKIVTDWKAPFGIVIVEKFRRGAAPAASCFAVWTQDRSAHASNVLAS